MLHSFSPVYKWCCIPLRTTLLDDFVRQFVLHRRLHQENPPMLFAALTLNRIHSTGAKIVPFMMTGLFRGYSVFVKVPQSLVAQGFAGRRMLFMGCSGSPNSPASTEKSSDIFCPISPQKHPEHPKQQTHRLRRRLPSGLP